MNNSTTFDPNDNVHGFTYGIVFTIGMLFLIIVILFACAKLRLPLNIVSGWRAQPPTTTSATVQPIEEATASTRERQGIDDETLQSYPKLLYSQVRDSVLISCSICLDDFEDTDVLRRLPDCGHLYHVTCIDSWLKLHRTCPLCRTSPTPVRSDSQPSGLPEGETVAVRVE